MNYFDQDGIIINSGFKRGSIRLNLDRKVSEKLNFSFTSQLTRSHESKALVNTAGGSAGGVVMDALRANPATPVFDDKGDYTFRNGPLPYAESQVGNPVAYANKATDHRNVFRALVNASGEYEIIKGLKFKVLGGVDLNYGNNDSYIPSGLFFGNTTTTGAASRSTANKYAWVNENTLTYDKVINNHSVTAVAGFSAQRFGTSGYTASSQNFFTDALGSDNLAFGANVQTPSSNKSENSLASFFGRINYKLSNKYLLTVTMRADGSSRFGTDKKWGYFPSGAFAWRIIEEKFMQNISAISDLKLRAGYGVVGNQEIGSYNSMARYQSFPGHAQRTDYLSGPNRLVGLAKANIPNKELGWESTESYNFGIDAGLFSNRITLTADYYVKTTKDLLFQVAIPQATGFGNILLNAGSVGNKGLEIAVNTVNVDKGKFKWVSNLNFSRNRNKVLDLVGATQLFVGASSGSLFPGGNGATSILRVGEPIGSFYGYQFDGIYQTPEEVAAAAITSPSGIKAGDPRYIDQNGDHLLNNDDKIIIGSAQPKFIYGFTNTFTYGPFSLTVLLQGVQGNNVLNLNRYELESGIVTTNKLKTVNDRWTGAGTSNTIPKANSTLRRTVGISSDVIEDATFLRVKTVSLGYEIPVPAAIKRFVKSASIYVTAQNLFTFTNYSGYDPEVNSFGSDNLNLNTDYNSYPTAKTVLGGVRLNF
jgi:TonB-linked SusC/RagA family outer membrane protein